MEKTENTENRRKSTESKTKIRFLLMTVFTISTMCIFHQIHGRQHASEDDAGMSKHRLSPYNAYYHN